MMCKFLEQNIKYVVFGLSKNDKSKFSRPWTAMNDTTKTQDWDPVPRRGQGTGEQCRDLHPYFSHWIKNWWTRWYE
jgi:hypothetical protein